MLFIICKKITALKLNVFHSQMCCEYKIIYFFFYSCVMNGVSWFNAIKAQTREQQKKLLKIVIRMVWKIRFVFFSLLYFLNSIYMSTLLKRNKKVSQRNKDFNFDNQRHLLKAISKHLVTAVEWIILDFRLCLFRIKMRKENWHCIKYIYFWNIPKLA